MEHSFTPTEWKLMECLWEKGSVTGREAVDYLHAHAAWSRSTTLTMLRRMTEKGVIACSAGNGWIAMYGRQKGAFGSLHPTIKRCSAFRMEIKSEWFSPPAKRKITPAAMWTRPIWRLAEIFTISVSSQNG